MSLRRISLLLGLLVLLTAARGTEEPPVSWIDPDTGHRVHRLTREPGSATLYFNVNTVTPDGHWMVYTTPDRGVGLIDLTNFETRPLVPGPVGGGPGAVTVGRKTPTVYYYKPSEDRAFGSLWRADIPSGAARKIADLPRRAGIFALNADETLAAGSYIVGEGADYANRDAGQAIPARGHEEPKDKRQLMADRLAARLPMIVFTINLQTGELKNVLASTDWIDHLQFSPTDPTLLMYAHQGAWHQIEKLWTVRTDGSQNRHVAPRIMETEGHGHQWWDANGTTIWYDLHLMADVSFVASYDTKTGERTWLHYAPSEASIHFNSSHDASLFCGDGSQAEGAQWIYLFRPERRNPDHSAGEHLIHPGVLHAEKLVNMAKHNYRLEPNVTFTPDAKHVVFRSNIFGPTYVFAVEVQGATPAAR